MHNTEINELSEVTKLKDALMKAELANSTKSAFLAHMSHEMRTPLGVILGFVQLLKSPEAAGSEISYLNAIERNANQLYNLINEILDLAKIESGKMVVETFEFSLIELLTDLYVSMQLNCDAKKIKLHFKIINPVPRVLLSDPTRLRQILYNILSNAIKFTSMGHVQLSISFSNDMLCFEVTDTGCGIGIEKQAQLFQFYKQADETVTRKHGGTGLGLVLTQKLAEALGGNFWLEKSTPGLGSTFIAQVQARAVAENIVKTCAEQNFEIELNKSSGSKSYDQLKGLRILLVEDSKDNQDLFSIYLKKQKAEIFIAGDGEEAVSKSSKEDFDLILMDLQMPKMDGLTAVQLLRQQGFAKPIIALTAHAMKSQRTHCLDAGFSDFLSKPAKSEELINKILKNISEHLH